MIRCKKHVWVVFVLAFAKALPQQSKTVKKEKESRVERAEFPLDSQKWIDSLTQECKKLKFYKETDGKILTYELKCKCNGASRSIEFSDIGRLEDVEITIKKRKISKEVRAIINTTLDSIASKNRIEKVQLQYLPSTENIQMFSQKINAKNFDHYEIIAAFKEKRKIYRKELLFNKEGVLINSRNIKRLEYDFLLF